MATGSLVLTLELEKNECTRGESVFFTVTILNDTGKPIPDFIPPEPDNETISVVVTGPKFRKKSCQLAAKEREGGHIHGSHTAPAKVTLGSKHSLSARGEILEWFGELEPGDYQIHAEHIYLLESGSEPVKLRVLPAKPTSAFIPRCTTQGPAPFIPAVWSHKQKKGIELFHQQYSPSLPRSIRHCFKVAAVDDDVTPSASILADTDVRTGHVIWFPKPEKIAFAGVNLDSGQAGPVKEVKLEGEFVLLNPAVSMPSGDLWLPLASKDRNTVLMVKVAPDGSAKEHRLDLGNAKPLGAYVCFWEDGARLTFAWVGEGKREILMSRFPIDNPAAGFVTKSLHASDDPVIWIDAQLDDDAPAREAPYFEEDIPPDQKDRIKPPPAPPLVLKWVTRAPDFLEVASLDTTGTVVKRSLPIMLDGMKDPRCLSGVITYENETVLMLADDKDKLHIAGTISNNIRPLSEFSKSPIELKNSPMLVTATAQGRSPWVFVRYFDDETIRMVKIEPEEETDPIEAQEEAAQRGRGPRRS